MPEPRVLVYSLSTCVPCKELKQSLHKQGIRFEEVLLDDASPQRRDEMRSLFIEQTGYRFVPVVEVIMGAGRHWISNEGQEHIQKKVVRRIVQLVELNS